MPSRNQTTVPPADEEQLEERLVGVPPSPLITATSSLADNLFATTDPANTTSGPTITHVMLVTWQANDPNTRVIVDNVTTDDPPHDTRSTTDKKKQYIFTDGLLRIKLGEHTPVVIPKDKTQNVIWTYHDHVLANHPGWKETYRAVIQRFFWTICACTKPLNTRADDPATTRIPRHPWEVISIDLMGE